MMMLMMMMMIYDVLYMTACNEVGSTLLYTTSMYDAPAAIMYVGMAKLKIEESATRKQV